VNLRRPLLVLALTGTALAAPGSPAVADAGPAGQAAKPAVYWSLGHAVTEPRRIFTAFSSSPYLRRLSWEGWGTREAVGTGRWMSDCASCAPPAHRRGTIRLTGFVTRAEDRGVRTYRKAVVTVDLPDVGATDTTYRIAAGCP
jgi:hypothetical protein